MTARPTAAEKKAAEAEEKAAAAQAEAEQLAAAQSETGPVDAVTFAEAIANLTTIVDEPAGQLTDAPPPVVEVVIVRTGVTHKIDGDTPFLVRARKHAGYRVNDDGEQTVRVTARRGDVVLVDGDSERTQWAVAEGFLIPDSE